MPKKKLSTKKLVDAFLDASVVELAEECARRDIRISVTMGASKKETASEKPEEVPARGRYFRTFPKDDEKVVMLLKEAQRLDTFARKIAKEGKAAAAEAVLANSWAYSLAGAWLRAKLEGGLNEQPNS